MVIFTCTGCGADVRWHPGNGGQWLGAHPPRDWANCRGVIAGPRHQVSMPASLEPADVRTWLDG